MARTLRNILVFVAILSFTFAVPTTESYGVSVHEQRGSWSKGTKSRYQRIRDSIIETIWNVPKHTGCHSSKPKSEYVAPANFRSKYGRDVVLRFKLTTEEEVKAFAEAADILYLDIWDFTSDWVDIRIEREMLPSLLNLLPSSLQHSHKPLMHDLAQAVYDTYPSSANTDTWRARHNPVHRHQHDLFFSSYQPLSAIYPWLDLMAALFPDVATSFSIGKSAEGRDIPAIRVGAPLVAQDPDDQVRARQTILVVGGTHAREWVSVSTASYLAYSFITRYGEDPHITSILKHYDIIFVPVLNTDGYEYTWGTDRLWRKNRQSTSLPFCPGIDLDRSYPFQWSGEAQRDNPCTESYAGEGPFHAVEAKALADWAFNKTRDDDVVFMSYFDLHSYSQKVLYPYSYSCNVEPVNLENLQEVAFGIAKSLFGTKGHKYQVSPACKSQFTYTTEQDGKKVQTVLNSANSNGGSALDYFYAVMRVKYAYMIKLRDTGTYGYLLPKEDIIPSGREAFHAMVHFGRWLLSDRGIESVDGEEPAQESSATVPEGSEGVDEWQNRTPEYIFRSSQEDDDTVAVNHEDEDDEWERVFDEELRRRRR